MKTYFAVCDGSVHPVLVTGAGDVPGALPVVATAAGIRTGGGARPALLACLCAFPAWRGPQRPDSSPPVTFPMNVVPPGAPGPRPCSLAHDRWPQNEVGARRRQPLFGVCFVPMTDALC